MKRIFRLSFALLSLCLPLATEACPMCQGGTSGSSIAAYRGTTIFLVLLPFLTGWLIYRYIKREGMLATEE